MYKTMNRKNKYSAIRRNAAGSIVMTQRRRGKYLVTVRFDSDGNVVSVDLEICSRRS